MKRYAFPAAIAVLLSLAFENTSRCQSNAPQSSTAARSARHSLTSEPILLETPSGTLYGTLERPQSPRSEEHTSELQSHRDLHSFPTRRSSDLSTAARSARHSLTSEPILLETPSGTLYGTLERPQSP